MRDEPHTQDETDRPVERQRSAGGVVVQRRGDEGLRIAVMRSRYGTWVFPKGHIEGQEVPEQTALREVAEEIGLTELAVHGPLGSTEHEFEQGGRRFRKRVDWFLLEAPVGAQPRPDPDEGALDVRWFDAEKALSLLSHSDQRRVLRRAVARTRK